MLVQIARKDWKAGQGRYAVTHLDFSGLLSCKCADDGSERWYAHATSDMDCLVGVKAVQGQRRLLCWRQVHRSYHTRGTMSMQGT
ncbi:hypothetical protein EDC04DRAFT_2747752 [Pisolithus marmoratus]|nr:hypothetical protein EDC04DRAFT_2747752 [Pisolithus marmoratus]